MKPHPRIRKTVKWGGAVLTVLVLGLWTASERWWVRYYSYPWTVRMGHGAFVTIHHPTTLFNRRIGWSAGRHDAWEDQIWVVERSIVRGATTIDLPLWSMATLAGVVTVAAWRLDSLARRRERALLCVKCGYDRTGLAVGAVCPECGAPAL